MIESSVAMALPPEFRNRLGSTVIFRKLSKKDIFSIIDLRIREIEDRARKNGKKIKFVVSDAAKEHFSLTGYSSSLGARPLMRVINNEVLGPLSLLLLRGEVLSGEMVHVDFDPVKGSIVVKKNHQVSDEFLKDEDDEDEVMSVDTDDDDDFIEEEPLD
jgi:ATP-dependent Clp protease ATP-binding subunit ClpB